MIQTFMRLFKAIQILTVNHDQLFHCNFRFYNYYEDYQRI